MLTPAERGRLVRAAVAWLWRQRRRHRPAGRCLTAAEKAAYSGWFSAGLLSAVRLRVVEGLEPPGLPALARRAGLGRLLDFRRLEGIALVDTVVLTQRNMPPPMEVPVLIFHELVHADQFRRLGASGFVRRYLGGWLLDGGRGGRSIPLESEALRLERRFRRGVGPHPRRLGS